MSLSDAFFKNPVAWILFIAFLIAEYGNWTHTSQLDRVCDLTGPHDIIVTTPATDRQELDNICGERQGDAENPN